MIFRRGERVAADAPDPKEPGLLDRQRGGPRTVIGPRTRVRGALRGRGPILVCGTFRGEIAVDGPLSVAPGATLEADVTVDRAHVAGILRGGVRAAAFVRLDPEGEIDGDLSTPIIDLRPGAVLRGSASVTGPPGNPRR